MKYRKFDIEFKFEKQKKTKKNRKKSPSITLATNVKVVLLELWKFDKPTTQERVQVAHRLIVVALRNRIACVVAEANATW